VNVHARIAKAAALAAFLTLTGNDVYSCFIKPAPLASPFGTFTLYFSSGGALGSGAHFLGGTALYLCVWERGTATGDWIHSRDTPVTGHRAGRGEWGGMYTAIVSLVKCRLWGRAPTRSAHGQISARMAGRSTKGEAHNTQASRHKGHSLARRVWTP
jgi:hypothetical protein